MEYSELPINFTKIAKKYFKEKYNMIGEVRFIEVSYCYENPYIDSPFSHSSFKSFSSHRFLYFIDSKSKFTGNNVDLGKILYETIYDYLDVFDISGVISILDNYIDEGIFIDDKEIKNILLYAKENNIKLKMTEEEKEEKKKARSRKKIFGRKYY